MVVSIVLFYKASHVNFLLLVWVFGRIRPQVRLIKSTCLFVFLHFETNSAFHFEMH